jgi:flagellar M-ring protein FliF
MEPFKRALESIRRTWGTLGTSQKVLLSASAAAMVLLLVWGSTAATGRAWVRVAGTELRVEERDQVQRKLAEKRIPHEVRNLEVYVPRENADAVILELAGEGILSDRAVWKFLEDESIFVSKWQLEKQYQVALQGKLELMIRRVDAVRSASVQISQASEAREMGFAHGSKASASVQVELHPGKSLSRQNVIAIAGLVARAVPGLDMDRVHLMDTKGNVHRVPRTDGPVATGELRDIEARLEEDIKAKIHELWEFARVVVNATAQGTELRTRDRKYEKPVPRVVEEQQRVVKDEPSGSPGGIKGESQVGPDRPSAARRDEREETSRVENQVNQSEVERWDPMGIIEKITVGVLIPLAEGEKEPMTEQEAKAFVLAAAGPKADAAGISVKYIPTRRPEPVAAASLGERALSWLAAHWTTPLLAFLALAALVVMSRVVRGAAARGGAEEIQALQAALAETPGGGEAGAPEGEVGRVRQGIRDLIGRNPAQAAASLKQWMTGR